MLRANPRLKNARRLVDDGAVRPCEGHPGVYRVRGGRDGQDEYVVRTEPAGCSCRWWRRYGGARGACKHLLAARLSQEALHD